MTKVEIEFSGDALIEEVTVATPRATTPATATPASIGLVELSLPSTLIPGPAGPPGADSTVPGPPGAAGAPGAPGTNGVGVPAGGTTGQVLAKIDATNYNTQWVAQTGGSGGGVTDGDKGDIVVSASGATWMFDSGVISPVARGVLDDATTAAMLTTLGALPAASYTAADVMAKVQTLDGAGSGLDADLLDGQSSAWYLDNANSTGVLPAASFNDTTHGNRAGGTLHPAVTTSVNGFMIAADKTKLDGVATGAGVAVPPATVAPLMNGTAAVGAVAKYAKEDHVHPTDTSREPTIAGGTTSQFWRGDKTWQPITIPPGTVISDTPPGSPVAGQLWWESDTGALFLYYTDANSSAWIQVNASPSSGLTAETRNRLVNPCFQISQENVNTSSTTSGYYGADEWFTFYIGTVVPTTQRVQSVTPNGSVNRYRVTVTTADATLTTTDMLSVNAKLEGIRTADFKWGTAGARQIVVRFGFRGPAGTYTVNLVNSALNRSYIATFTIAAGQANADTEQIIVIPGDTTGTWLTDSSGAGIIVRFVLAVGPTYQGIAGWQAGDFRGSASNTNGMATAGNVFELFDVGLYLDPLATGLAPAWTMPDEAQEQIACKRYWQNSVYNMFSGNVTNGGSYNSIGSVPVVLRVTPAIAMTNSVNSFFPATPGTGTLFGPQQMTEPRIANGAGAGLFTSYATLNARM